MTFALLAVAVAVLVWPATRRADLRLRRLVDAARLAGSAVPAERGRRLPAVPARWAGVLVAVATSGAAFVWRGPAVAIAAGAAAAVIAASITSAAARRDALARDRDLSAALRLLRGELDVGSRPEPALLAASSVAGAYGSAFEAGAGAVRDGTDIVAAMSGGGTSRPAPESRVRRSQMCWAGSTTTCRHVERKCGQSRRRWPGRARPLRCSRLFRRSESCSAPRWAAVRWPSSSTRPVASGCCVPA